MHLRNCSAPTSATTTPPEIVSHMYIYLNIFIYVFNGFVILYILTAPVPGREKGNFIAIPAAIASAVLLGSTAGGTTTVWCLFSAQGDRHI